MSTQSESGGGVEQNDSYVEISSTKLNWYNGRITGLVVSVEYFGEDYQDTTKNKVVFDVDGMGVAHLVGFETPIGSVKDLRVIPAAEYVAYSVDGIEGVQYGFRTLESQLNAGHLAVENRLKMDNVPADLRSGFETRG